MYCSWDLFTGMFVFPSETRVQCFFNLFIRKCVLPEESNRYFTVFFIGRDRKGLLQRWTLGLFNLPWSLLSTSFHICFLSIFHWKRSTQKYFQFLSSDNRYIFFLWIKVVGVIFRYQPSLSKSASWKNSQGYKKTSRTIATKSLILLGGDP